MIIKGISRRFTCAHGEQIDAIGAFWDEMTARYPGEPLVGVGYAWENDTLRYLIGWEAGAPDGLPTTLTLPDDGWETWQCATSDIAATYDRIYATSRLDWEIESHSADTWTLRIHRARGGFAPSGLP